MTSCPVPFPGGLSVVSLGITYPLSPPRHKSPNTKPGTPTFPSLHQASWKTGSKCIRQQLKFKQSLDILQWHHASPVYKPCAHKNLKYGVAVCVGTGRTGAPKNPPHLHTCTALIYIAVGIEHSVVHSLTAFSGFWIWSTSQTHWAVFHTHKLYLCRYLVSICPIFGGGVAELIYQSSAYFADSKKSFSALPWILFDSFFCFSFFFFNEAHSAYFGEL